MILRHLEYLVALAWERHFGLVLAVGAADENGEPLPSSNWGAAYLQNGLLAPVKTSLGRWLERLSRRGGH
jgi:hypothetical protein